MWIMNIEILFFSATLALQSSVPLQFGFSCLTFHSQILITCSDWVDFKKLSVLISIVSEMCVKEGCLSWCLLYLKCYPQSLNFFLLFENALKCFFLRKRSLLHVTKECNVIIDPVFFNPLQFWCDIWNIHFHFCKSWAEH